MAKLELDIPEHIYSFETIMRVRSTEIDMGQQLRSESLSAMFSEARSRYLYANGIREIDIEYMGILVTDSAIQFLSRARAREELLFEVGVYDRNKYGGDMAIRVTRMNDSSLISKGKFGFVCYNYIENRIMPLTDKMTELFAHSESDFLM